jgi:Undecaprenyl-phosphate galactose phosphotransferase WbaP
MKYEVSIDGGAGQAISSVQARVGDRGGRGWGWKRVLDLAIAAPLALFLAPLLLLVAALIKLRDGGPALFVQSRVGLNGETFRCLKFRTMVTDSAAVLERLLANDPVARAEWDADQKLRCDPRVTAVGRFLRKTSLDELPQLLNILKGEMSIVGPRPIVPAEIVRYGAHFNDYCAVKPGVTGLWQVSGRNDTTYAERVALDVAYVRNWSIWLDLSIILRTVPAVLFSKGAY